MVTISYFTLSFAVTLWLSRFLLKYVDRTRFLDHPADRKIHDRPVPRFGGIAFGLAIIILGWFLLNTYDQYTWYFLGAIGIFILGSVDDYWGITWKVKLPVQLFVGGLIAAQFIPVIQQISFFNLHLTGNTWAMMGLFIFWFVGILNAMNLIDGMDGLAGGYMILTAFGAMVIGWISGVADFTAINVIVVGAMMAFMIFNQHPAKFFMGDCGSLLLGYHVAVMPLFFVKASSSVNAIEIAPFLILTSYIIIDTIRVFFVRVRKRTHPLTPDKNHLHHQLLDKSQSYGGTLMAIFIFTSVSGAAAVFSVLVDYHLLWMIAYLLIMGVFALIPQANNMFVGFAAGIIKIFNKKKHAFTNQMKLPSVRFIPIFVLTYFAGLLMFAQRQLFAQSGMALLAFSTLIIVLYAFQTPSVFQRYEIILVVVGIIQIILLSADIMTESSLISDNIFFRLGTVIRYVSMTIIVVLTVLQYIIKSQKLTGQFWSTIDLLVLFLLIGLSSINVLGFGIPVIMAFELGVIYYANKLYIPRITGEEEYVATTAGN